MNWPNVFLITGLAALVFGVVVSSPYFEGLSLGLILGSFGRRPF